LRLSTKIGSSPPQDAPDRREATAWCARDLVVNVAQLELNSSNRCLGRSLVFCQTSHLGRRVMRYAEAVELLSIALQLKRMVARYRQSWEHRGKLRAPPSQLLGRHVVFLPPSSLEL
jgi:hypothetical protein